MQVEKREVSTESAMGKKKLFFELNKKKKTIEM